MENIRREKALQRAQARIREDEKLVLLFGFDQLLVVAGGQTVPRPGGAVDVHPCGTLTRGDAV